MEEHRDLSLEELCHACSVETTSVVEFVDEGILRPSGRAQASWRFSAVSILTVKRTIRLQRDLGVNLAGAALALDLMEEIEQLRRRLGVVDRP